jgi:hypothetical protein
MCILPIYKAIVSMCLVLEQAVVRAQAQAALMAQLVARVPLTVERRVVAVVHTVTRQVATKSTVVPQEAILKAVTTQANKWVQASLKTK